jgi:hypothetical protein
LTRSDTRKPIDAARQEGGDVAVKGAFSALAAAFLSALGVLAAQGLDFDFLRALRVSVVKQVLKLHD